MKMKEYIGQILLGVIAILLGWMVWQNQYFIGKLDKIDAKQTSEENRVTDHISSDNAIDESLVKIVDDHESRIKRIEIKNVEIETKLNHFTK